METFGVTWASASDGSSYCKTFVSFAIFPPTIFRLKGLCSNYSLGLSWLSFSDLCLIQSQQINTPYYSHAWGNGYIIRFSKTYPEFMVRSCNDGVS